MFSEKEVDYIKSQRLARIATVSKELQPDVAAVGFEFDGENFYIGGIRQTKTYKYKNVASGNSSVALVIDDVESVDQDPRTSRSRRATGTVRTLFEGTSHENVELGN